MNRDGWWWVSLRYATFGLEVKRGRVVGAPPVSRPSLGRRWADVHKYYKRRGATIKRIGFLDPPF